MTHLLDAVEPHLTAPTWLSDLADDAGELRLDALPRVVEDGDVIVGGYLDEELRAYGSAEPRSPDPHWTAWLGDLDGRRREVAHDVVERLHLAFGLVEDLGDGTGLIAPDLTAVAGSFDRARWQVVWTCEPAGLVRGEGVLVLDDGTVVHDLHDHDGIHLLLFRSHDRAGAILADALRLRPGIDGPVDRCRVSAGPVWRSDAPDRTLEVERAADGLHLVDGGTPASPADDDRLAQLAADLLG